MALEGKISVLAVDDDESVRLYLKTILGNKYEVHLAQNGAEGLEILTSVPVDLVLLDLQLKNDEDGLDLLKKVRRVNQDVPVIIISGVQMVTTVVQAIKDGASDYIHKPFEREELFLAISRVLEKRRLENDNVLLKEALEDLDPSSDPIIGQSEVIRDLKRSIAKLRNQHVNVFLFGETGTGKEMFARRLHQQEGDPKRPFVSVNCAAIPETLIESVLFGHEKGSFTGATERRIGKFELAHGGDIFLDEITCLNLELQAKLLRVLEEKEVERIGSSAPKKIEFRVISAANENIVERVAKGEFRSDLFYRLNAVTIELPTLNDRREDIVPLAEHFMRKLKRTQAPKVLSEEVKQLLKEHDWRGNVRELRNTIENILIFSKHQVIHPEDVPFFGNGRLMSAPRATVLAKGMDAPVGKPAMAADAKYNDLLQAYEKELLMKRLERNRWSKTKTCKDLGITRNKLYRRMADLGIEL